MASALGSSSGPDLNLSSLGWRTFDPLAVFLGSLADAAAAAEATLPPTSATARELRNKLSAFTGFRYAGHLLGSAEESDDPREDFRRAWALEPAARLWTVEGLGYRQARRGEALHPEDQALPAVTGRGLALAESLVQSLPPITSCEDASLALYLDKFLQDSRDGAPADCWQATYENLGLMLRLTQPGYLSRIHQALEKSPGLQSLLWHGAGRGLYFAPSELASVPGRPWRALQRARRAPNSNARHNALAGLAWATTLVNIQSPSIVAARLADAPHRTPRDNDALAHGIAGAAATWLHATQDSAPIETLQRQGSSAIAKGCQRALLQLGPELLAGAPFGALFSISGEGEA